MEYLLIFGLIWAIYELWRRVDRLEQRLREIEPLSHVPYEAPPPERTRPLEPDLTEDEAASEPMPRADPASAEPAITRELPESTPEVGAVEASEPDMRFDSATFLDRSEGFRLPRFDFEDIFGRKLPIWAGGVALAVGGIFLVRYSIEAGLLGPEVRVALSFLAGLVLLVAAEAAYRFEHRVRDPRVRQAFAGAGIATLYASFYLAGSQYGLIGPAIAFTGLALVTAIALGLSLRFGLPAAVLGLVGGFATPLLVASEEANLPVLSFYLTLLTAGLALTARRLGQRWLGAAALAGGFVWGMLMLAGRPSADSDWLALGLYLLALGAAIPLLLGGEGRIPWTRLASAALAAVQMAALVGLAGYDLLTWGLYLLLAAAMVVLSWRTRELLFGNAFILAIGTILLATWPDPGPGDFALVAVPLALLGLANPLARMWRDPLELTALAQVAVGAPVLAGVTLMQFGTADNDVFQPGLAATTAALFTFPALALWRLWRVEDRKHFLVLPASAAAILAFAALHLLLPDWAEVLGAAAVALAAAGLAWCKPRGGLTALAWAGGITVLVTLFSTGSILDELGYLVDEGQGSGGMVHAVLRWGAAALPFLALAFIERRHRVGRIAEVLLALVTYGLVAQFIPGTWLAWSAALLAAGCLWWRRQAPGFWGAMFGLGVLWALVPFGTWLVSGIAALAGEPVLVTALPELDTVMLRILPAGLVAGLAAWRMQHRKLVLAGFGTAALIGGICLAHILFKQLFQLSDETSFVSLGIAERTVWEALLAAGGVALARFAPQPLLQRLGAIGVALGLAHLSVFTLTLHNPLWDEQAVGTLPVANWLLPAHALAAAMVWWLFAHSRGLLRQNLQPLRDALMMLLVSLWALSELRHSYSGTILVDLPMSQGEDLLRSLLGIVLALAFLWWGSRKQQRSWRIGSLVLMLLAVLKVFMVDAAGLEGLLRIASFFALGVSLIGIGWVYSRQLRSTEAAA
ncbi:DUF2339 domain-containing protein [Aurantiacibacter gilvus]|uniref:DUF2339 domain-containing protein n=1 Tax=Aurantiacibacter gilvus TaxID=3139141 RepID=A0ABU9IIA8_9SPHN